MNFWITPKTGCSDFNLKHSSYEIQQWSCACVLVPASHDIRFIKISPPYILYLIDYHCEVACAVFLTIMCYKLGMLGPKKKEFNYPRFANLPKNPIGQTWSTPAAGLQIVNKKNLNESNWKGRNNFVTTKKLDFHPTPGCFLFVFAYILLGFESIPPFFLLGFESIYFFGGCGKENRKAGQHRKKKGSFYRWMEFSQNWKFRLCKALDKVKWRHYGSTRFVMSQLLSSMVVWHSKPRRGKRQLAQVSPIRCSDFQSPFPFTN